MKTLNYSIKINASKEHVWDTMLNKQTYQKWVKAFSEGSTYVGEWKEGAEIIFYDPNMGGTKAVIKELKLYSQVYAEHIGLVDKEAKDVVNEYSANWIGTTEKYTLTEQDGVTTVSVQIQTHKDYVDMFNSGWDKALKNLKDLCEK